MKVLLALAGLATVFGLSVPASADPEPVSTADDTGFLTDLHTGGIAYPSRDAAVASGKAVCTCLNNGESGLELVHDVKAHNPGFDMESASNFAMIAAKHYCPQQLSKA
jgi:Protein of unknown function (DUF732)